MNKSKVNNFLVPVLVLSTSVLALTIIGGSKFNFGLPNINNAAMVSSASSAPGGKIVETLGGNGLLTKAVYTINVKISNDSTGSITVPNTAGVVSTAGAYLNKGVTFTVQKNGSYVDLPSSLISYSLSGPTSVSSSGNITKTLTVTILAGSGVSGKYRINLKNVGFSQSGVTPSVVVRATSPQIYSAYSSGSF